MGIALEVLTPESRYHERFHRLPEGSSFVLSFIDFQHDSMLHYLHTLRHLHGLVLNSSFTPFLRPVIIALDFFLPYTDSSLCLGRK